MIGRLHGVQENIHRMIKGYEKDMNSINHEIFSDIKIINNFSAIDYRGEFTKIYNENEFIAENIQMKVKEIFYSVSHKNVIRGMHFQIPPYAHDKLIHVISGRVKDVIVDLRKNSENYLKYIELELSGENKQAIYIPKGFAHGFQCLEENTVMMYMVSEGYVPDSDAGIRWDSFGMDWKTDNPIISEKDNNLPKIEEYNSPFN